MDLFRKLILERAWFYYAVLGKESCSHEGPIPIWTLCTTDCLQLFVVGTMYCDLFVPTPPPLLLQPTKNAAGNQQKKGKGKQAQQQQLVSRVGTEGTTQTMFTIAQLNALEKRIDMLIHCMLSDLR